MSLAELCKNTAKKAKEKERCLSRCAVVESIKNEESSTPKPRIGPHTPPLPREPSSPCSTPEPSSTADFSRSSICERSHKKRHRDTYESSSGSNSPEVSYRSHGQIRSYSAGSSRSHANATSTTTNNNCVPKYSVYGSSQSETTTTQYRHVSGTRTVSPPPLPAEQRTHEKVPYYSDQKRERDRLRRKYGDDYSTEISLKRSRISPAKQTHYIDEKYDKNRIQRSYNVEYNMQSMSTHRHRHRSSGSELHYNDRSRRFSPFSNHYLQHRYRDESRSRSRESRRSLAHPQTQIITIPVAVPPDYPYAFASWSPQWGTPFPLSPLMSPPSVTSVRPPPIGIPPYNPNMFRPLHRYPSMRNLPTRGSMTGNFLRRQE